MMSPPSRLMTTEKIARVIQVTPMHLNKRGMDLHS